MSSGVCVSVCGSLLQNKQKSSIIRKGAAHRCIETFVMGNLPNEATGSTLNQFNKKQPYGVCFPNSQILFKKPPAKIQKLYRDKRSVAK